MSTTLLIIIITVIVSYLAWKNEALLQRLMLNPYSITKFGQWDRFLTSGFIHADQGHLFFNMFTLFFFGDALEKSLRAYLGGSMGTIVLIGIYLLSICLSDVPTYLKNKNNMHYNSLGASGGVSGVVFASILFNPTTPICLYGIICLPGFIYGILYVIYSIYENRKGGSYINHSAHLWGAIVGVVCCILAYPNVISIFLGSIKNWIQ